MIIGEMIMTERFVSFIKRDDFGYTVWQREHFDELERKSDRGI